MTDNAPAPMPIEKAVTAYFPHGGVTRATLLAAIHQGALGFEKIGRRYFVTEADILKWRKKCRDDARARGFGCSKDQAESPSMSSSTERSRSAQDAALTVSKMLRKPSRTTSPAHSGPTPENVTYLESRSQRS